MRALHLPALSNRAFIGSSVLFTFVGLLALLTIVAVDVALSLQTRAAMDDVVDAQNIRIHSARLLNIALDAETGQRGYLLTGDEAYLPPYTRGLGLFDQEITFLRTVADDKPSVQAELTQISRLIHEKFAELAATVDLVKAGRPADALAMVKTNRGFASMEEARIGIRKLITDSDQQLTSRVEAVQWGSRWALVVTIIGCGVVLLIIGGAIASVVIYTRHLRAARQQVEDTNRGLEGRVVERTAALTRANREIQQFAYIVSHDLRSPLVNVLGFTRELEASLEPLTRFVQSGAAEPDPALRAEIKEAVTRDLPESLAFIRTSATKMDGLINSILRLSREGHRVLRPERLDMQRLLDTQVETVRHTLDQIGGTVVIEGPMPALVSDKLGVEQVFGNLVDNAIKYRDPQRPLRVVVRCVEQGGRVIYKVTDNGRGIAKGDHERIFELFRRSGRQDQRGEGLGLSFVRAIVRRLDGDIMVSSELGVGTTFTINLPGDPAAFVGPSRPAEAERIGALV